MTNARNWSAFAPGEDTAGVLFLTGADSQRASELVAGAGIRGPVLADPDGELQRHFGRLLPSSYALVDGDGFIRMADSRPLERSCDWNFVEQVVALRAALG